MNEELTKLLSSSFLFSGLDENRISELLSKLSYRIAPFKKGELIFSPSNFRANIGFIVEGECEVTHPHSDTPVRIRALRKGDTFGIISLFSNKTEYPTSIIACRMSKVLFLAKEDVITLVKSDPQISLNVITFLADRVSFLNSKISTFSAKSVEVKLASHLLSLFRNDEQEKTLFNKAKAAQAISVGRASLYRAIASLSETGCVSFDNKYVYLIDRTGLERIIK